MAKRVKVVEGQVAKFIPREEFRKRFEGNFFDPAFDGMRGAIAQLEAIAWDGYKEGRKSPVTAKAGPGFDDPDYDLSVEWRRNRDRIQVLETEQRRPGAPTRVLVVCGSPRNDGTCPGEASKTWRRAMLAKGAAEEEGATVDFLDLSLPTSEYGKRIFPCKGCVSTAMPLCHWPCSCYPNHASNQVGDWMAEIYERWTAAHAILIVAPTHWYHSPSIMKAMIDRLVCADGGNPDPSSTSGKDAKKAKRLELDGWDYPKHLAGRVYGVVVHGDVAGIESHRRNLADWLDWMGLIEAGPMARLDRYVGYYAPYATSHQDLDADAAFQEETRNAARAVVRTTKDVREGRHERGQRGLEAPRPK